MKKTRVFELAQKIGKPNKELIEILNEMGIKVKSHLSFLKDEVVLAFYKEFNIKDEPEKMPEQKKEKQPFMPFCQEKVNFREKWLV